MSFVGLPWRPRLSAGGVTWTAELPMDLWGVGDQVVGGSDVSADGTPAAFVVREQELLRLTLGGRRLRSSTGPACRPETPR